MRLSSVRGLIRRRILVNFRVDPGVVMNRLPAPFEPMRVRGHALVGICLIRLKQIRPRGLPATLGVSSENAAHRIAVEWNAEDGALQMRNVEHEWRALGTMRNDDRGVCEGGHDE